MSSLALPSLFAVLVSLGPPLAAPVEGPRSEAHHAEVDDRPRLDFDESIGLGAAAPGVVGLEQAAARKRDEDGEIPRLNQNPQLLVMPGARVISPEDRGFELQAQFTQGWNLEGYGKRRRAAAAAETDLLEAEARGRALEQRRLAARAWIELHGAERRLALAKAELVTTRELVATLERSQGLGVATRIEVAEARTSESEAEAVVVELEGQVHDIGLALASAAGQTTQTPVGTRGSYPAPVLPADDELRRRFAEVEELPAVSHRRVAARAAAAQAEASARARGTVLQTGALLMLESTGELLLFGVVGTNLPVVDRNQRAAGQARTRARVAAAEAEQAAVELTATLATALHELHHSADRLELMEGEIVPALDELVVAHTLALEVGESTRVELLSVQRRRWQAERELERARAAWVWARVEAWLYLEAMTSPGDDQGAPQ